SDPGAAVSGMHAPIAIAMHPAGNRVYVLSQALDDKPAAMAVFNRVTNSADPNYGRLSFAGTTSAGVPAAPRRLAVAPQSLYISAATAVSVFTLDPVSGLPQHDADHSAGAAWQPGAMVVSPQQALLLVGSDDAPHLR